LRSSEVGTAPMAAVSSTTAVVADADQRVQVAGARAEGRLAPQRDHHAREARPLM
jgi:hypothetical protein